LLVVRGSLTGKADMSVYMPYNDEKYAPESAIISSDYASKSII